MRDDESLGQLYRAAITTVPDSGAVDPARARATTRKHQTQRHGAAAGLLAAALLAGLLVVAPPWLGSSRYLTAAPQPDPTVAAEPAMNIDPSAVPPGALITLHFPTGLRRGLYFSLESRQATDWRLDYYLVTTTDGNPARRPWYRADDPDMVFFDVGISGPGGEKVLIPDVATPGDYQLCIAGSKQTACSALTIT